MQRLTENVVATLAASDPVVNPSRATSDVVLIAPDGGWAAMCHVMVTRCGNAAATQACESYKGLTDVGW